MIDADELNLWYEQQLVGYLWRNDLDRIGFRYDNDWLTSELRFPISLQLPLIEEEFSPDEGIAHRFFSNLLPEGQARTNIINSLKMPDSDFALLKAIGGECAGAFNILPYMSVPMLQTDWEYTKFSDERLKTLINRRGQIFSFRNDDNVPIRLSLAGAQDKCPVLNKDGEFFLPENEAPTSHILKFQIVGFQHVPAYEVILMKLAQSLKLPVADIELQILDGLPADNPDESFVVIERYDRVSDDEGNIHRLHQEDFCQALGYGHEKKYQVDGGPAFVDCLNLIKEKSDEPVIDTQSLLNWQIFNVLAGNSDGHAKNLSILYSGDNSLRLAPFYDLVCTRAIEHIATNLAFAIGGQYDPGQINKNNWLAFARENDIGSRFLLGMVKELAERIIDALPEVLQDFKDDYGKYEALQRVEHVINSQCKRTLKSL
jgi:serine/threonine-protein kinase HipA